VAAPAAVDAAARLDAALRDANAAYAAFRDRGAVSAPRVVAVDPGAFDALRARRIADGAAPQQLKQSRVLRRPEDVALLRRHNRGAAAAASGAPAPGTLAGVAEWTRRYF